MIESDWLNCLSLDHLLDSLPVPLSERRWRLLACGICRQVGAAEDNADLRAVLETAEAFADGQQTARKLGIDHRKAARLTRSRSRTALQSMSRWNQADDPDHRAELYSQAQLNGRRAAFAHLISQAAAEAVRSFFRPPPGHTPAATLLATFSEMLLDEQAAVVHDVAGNPFHRKAIAPDLLTWRDGFIGHLARDIYDHQTWEDVAILGDALEDAGCTDRTILEHCHGKGPHVRGCWVVDRLTGRGSGPRAFHRETLVRHYPERYCTPLEPVIARGSGPQGSKVHVLMESANLAEAVEFVSEIDPADLPDPTVPAEIVAALRSHLGDLTPRGRYLAGVRLTLLGVTVPSGFPRPEYALGEAAHDALTQAVQDAVMVPLETTARGRMTPR